MRATRLIVSGPSATYAAEAPGAAAKPPARVRVVAPPRRGGRVAPDGSRGAVDALVHGRPSPPRRPRPRGPVALGDGRLGPRLPVL